MRTLRLMATGLLAASLLLPASRAIAEPAKAKPLILAVHPYLPPQEIMQRFTPLADYLAKSLDRQVQVRKGRDYNEHIEAIGSDQVDLAYIGPSAYVQLTALYGKKPLLARFEVNGQPHLRGVIVTRADSPLQQLNDLKGKSFAFGDPSSTMSHIVPLYMLIKAGVPEQSLAHQQFLGAHRNVALAVLTGDFDAGAVKEETYQEYAGKGLRALATTPPISEHLFVTRANLAGEEIETARRALLRLKDAPNGMAILDGLHKGMTALVPVADGDYDNLRAIERTLERLQR